MIHPTADIEPGVTIGRGTNIWNRAQLRAGCSIGENCVIGRDVFIDEGVYIGSRVKVQNAALIYHGVTVEDDVFIGPGAILTNDRYPRSFVATPGPGILAREGDWTVSPVVLRRGCSIGAGAVVVAGVSIGQFAVVGAGAVVRADVAPHGMVVGCPALSPAHPRRGISTRFGSRVDFP
jgi:UDP-2-acetamido-3-amino-2,3-dideoxy-glucuronate N-acetyltransferase